MQPYIYSWNIAWEKRPDLEGTRKHWAEHQVAETESLGRSVGNKHGRLVAMDGLDPYKMRRPIKEYSLPGSYRMYISKPENGEWEIVRLSAANVT